MIDVNVAVSRIMTTNIITVNPNDSMSEVDEVFRKNNIHHIPVVDKEGQLKGIISKTDYNKLQHGFTLFKTAKSEEYNQAYMRSLLAEDVMTSQVAKLSPDDSISVAAGIFKENLFHALPVVSEGRLVGLITTFDLISYCFKKPAYLDS